MPPRKKTKLRVYKLMDYFVKAVTGSWYSDDLHKMSDNQYRIEKVLRRRILPDGTKNYL